LQRSNKGRDWVVCKALAAAIGYQISVQKDCIELEVCGGAAESVHLADSGRPLQRVGTATGTGASTKFAAADN
jgi:hypothetical protein